MSQVCPTVLASNEAEYALQMRIVTPFSERIQIDLMDGEFAPNKSVGLEEVWWSPSVVADIHLMYQNPFDYLQQLLHLKPNMVIIHVETMVHHMHFAAELHKEGIKAGLAILPETPVSNIEQILHSFDHLLIFSGDLGHFGGEANLDMLSKVKQARAHHGEVEIGWDGGVNAQNAKQLVDGGVDVLNVGGFIQKAPDPAEAYKTLVQTIN
jgi:ribulose-phosphate 3-epimerase